MTAQLLPKNDPMLRPFTIRGFAVDYLYRAASFAVALAVSLAVVTTVIVAVTERPEFIQWSNYVLDLIVDG